MNAEELTERADIISFYIMDRVRRDKAVGAFAAKLGNEKSKYLFREIMIFDVFISDMAAYVTFGDSIEKELFSDRVGHNLMESFRLNNIQCDEEILNDRMLTYSQIFAANKETDKAFRFSAAQVLKKAGLDPNKDFSSKDYFDLAYRDFIPSGIRLFNELPDLIIMPVADLSKIMKHKVSSGELTDVSSKQPSKGCYIATAVYGSYDCPEVWILRRFRDSVLESSLIGKIIVRVYYSISPHIVKALGKYSLFNKINKAWLDIIVKKLHNKGFSDRPYLD